MIEYKVIVDDDGYIKWFNVDGSLYMEDVPALDGSRIKRWYKNEKRHRENGPAGQEYYTEIVRNLEEVETKAHNLLVEMRKEYEAESYLEKDISKWSTPIFEGLVEKLGLAIKAKTEFDCFANLCDDLTPEE